MDQQPIFAAGVGALNAPIVIAVDNHIGANRLKPLSVPPEFKLVSHSQDAAEASGADASTIVFTALASNDLPQLSLQSVSGAGATSADISVAARGHFFHKAVHCEHGGHVSIDISNPASIEDQCDQVTTLCPLEIGQPSGQFSVQVNDIDADNIGLLLIPENAHPKIDASPLAVCLLSPMYDSARAVSFIDPAFNTELMALAKQCDDSPTTATKFASKSVALCVGDKLRASNKITWEGACGGFNFSASNARSYFLFVRSNSGSDGCASLSISQ
jgi:hypothetical protein